MLSFAVIYSFAQQLAVKHSFCSQVCLPEELAALKYQSGQQVLAKPGDCMPDWLLCMTQARARLLQASKEVGRPIVHKFSHEALVEAGAAHEVPPFSVVASNTMDLSVGR